MMIFQLSHANEKTGGDVGYTIKHAFVQASSLVRAHVFVFCYGYRISPEYYDDMDDDFKEPSEEAMANHPLQNYTLEQFESMNEECSQGEHFWHALKLAANEGGIIHLNGQLLFKVTVRFQVPCLHHYTSEPSAYNLFKTEMNSDVYQFRADDSLQVLQYLRENRVRFNLTDYFQELPEVLDWKMMEKIAEERNRCTEANHIHGLFIQINCESLEEPLLLVNSNM